MLSNFVPSGEQTIIIIHPVQNSIFNPPQRILYYNGQVKAILLHKGTNTSYAHGEARNQVSTKKWLFRLDHFSFQKNIFETC